MAKHSGLCRELNKTKKIHLQAVYRIFGYLKQVPKRKLYFGPTKTSISEDRFKSFDWEDFYKDAQESIPIDMPSLREEINVWDDRSNTSNRISTFLISTAQLNIPINS